MKTSLYSAWVEGKWIPETDTSKTKGEGEKTFGIYFAKLPRDFLLQLIGDKYLFFQFVGLWGPIFYVCGGKCY